MFNNNNKVALVSTPVFTSVEEILNELCKYGKPRLYHDGTGWVCVVDMHVAAAGVSFDVRSDFSTKKEAYTQSQATQQCLTRIIETLAIYQKG